MAITEFETNAGGTTTYMQVEVAPRYFRPENDAMPGFANHLVNALLETADEHSAADTGGANVNEQTVFSVARSLEYISDIEDAIDMGTTATEIMEQFEAIERELVALTELDSRFVVARCMARNGYVAAGDFGLDTALEVCGELRRALPAPEEVDDGWAFPPQLWTRDPAPEIEISALVSDITVSVNLRTTDPDFGLLREYADAVDTVLQRLPGLPAAEYYAEVAHAKQLISLRNSQRFQEHDAFRRSLLTALVASLERLTAHSRRFAFPLRMASGAAQLDEQGQMQALQPLLENIEGWLPRTVNELLPPWWFGEENAGDLDDVLESLTTGVYVRLVAVETGAFTGDGLPERETVQAVAVSALSSELLAAPRVMLFAEEA